MIKLKRVYESIEATDGLRVLVERLWPRGISKEKAALDLWLKEVAPTTELRKWFNHDPEKWEEFQRRYGNEIKDNKGVVAQLQELINNGNVSFIYSSRDTEHNAAIVLKDFFDNHAK